MEIYYKSDKIDFNNTKLMSNDIFNKLNFITVITHKNYCKIIFYLQNINLEDKIKQEILMTNDNISFDKNIIGFESVEFNSNDVNIEITKIIKNILNILLKFNIVDSNTIFGFSYDYLKKLHNGCLTTNDIITIN